MYENCHTGHYIPQLAEVLLDHNAQSTDFKFNIKGVAVRKPDTSVSVMNCLLCFQALSSINLVFPFIFSFFFLICSMYLVRLVIHFLDLIGMFQQHTNSFGPMG